MAYNVRTKSKRAPSIAVPGSKGSTRPTRQRGGGGNKEAGSREVTAATAPTITVSPEGVVTTSNGADQHAAEVAHIASERRATTAKRKANRARRAQTEALTSARRHSATSKRTSEAQDKRIKATEEALSSSKKIPASTAIISSDKPARAAGPSLKQREKEYSEAENAAILRGETGPEAAKTAERLQKKYGIEGLYNPTGESSGTRARNLKGTPSERKAARTRVQQTRKMLAKSSPDLSSLSPEQKRIAKLDIKAHKKYPNVPVSVLMADTEQESNFNPAAESSAGAFGATQFIPSTAASYGVKRGTDQKAVRSQVFGQAHLLSDSTKQYGSNKEALGHYYGDPTASYSSEVLDKAQKYTFLDRSGNPQAVKNYKLAVKEAKELGLKVASNTISVGKPPKKVVTKFQQIKHAANELESKGFPYSWGGGHNTDFAPGGDQENGGPGYDCSGAVSWVLHQAGILSEPLTSGNMGSVLAPGPGLVTVYYNSGHTFLKIGNEYWGTSVGDSGSGGIGRHPAPSEAYLSEYNVGHVPGLGRKQALQMGFKPGAFSTTSTSGAVESAPGMTTSTNGTTATIDPGKGTEQNKATFSKRPIILTPQQHYNRTVRKLKSVGIGVKHKQEEPSETLKALQEKYKVVE
ncbi:MAG: transglycosylase SLT domain-containing protein [Actinobacteria bacterium]|nr:transglycosylase SLT domain-containing protein [Actinomycetota bacterium]